MCIRAKFYVVADLHHLAEVAEGDETWWCVARDCSQGDLGYVYWKGNGIKLAFKFVDFQNDEAPCKQFGMATATVRIVSFLDQPITFQELKKHRLLNKTVAVRRNFQDRWFDLEAGLVEELSALITGEKGISQ